MTLDDRGSLGGNNPVDCESRCGEERAEIGFGAFAAANYKHQQFNHPGWTMRVNYVFYQEESSSRSHRMVRVSQYLDRVPVRPVVNYTF